MVLLNGSGGIIFFGWSVKDKVNVELKTADDRIVFRKSPEIGKSVKLVGKDGCDAQQKLILVVWRVGFLWEGGGRVE